MSCERSNLIRLVLTVQKLDMTLSSTTILAFGKRDMQSNWLLNRRIAISQDYYVSDVLDYRPQNVRHDVTWKHSYRAWKLSHLDRNPGIH